MLWDLFFTFFKIGLVSFGGGYAMIPLIEYEVLQHGWLSTQEFTDAIAVAGMSPGPLATNGAVFIGFKVAGFLGATIALVSISLPSLLIILLVALFFRKIQHHPTVQAAFYGMRPVITGLIVFAAIRFAMHNHIIGEAFGVSVSSLFVLGASFALLLWTKLNPVFVILLSGIAGILLFA